MVKLVGKSNECPNTDQIGLQKMTRVLRQVKWLTHKFRCPETVRLIGKQWWDSSDI